MERELRQMFVMKETEMAVPVTLSPELRKRIGRQRMVMGGLVATAAFALVIGGFAGARSLSNDALPIPPAEENEEKDTTEVDFPALTNMFVSPRNGFSVNHPDGVTLTAAKQLWNFSKQVDAGFDVVETGLAAVFKGVSTSTEFAYLDGASVDEQVDEHLSEHYVGGCGVPRSQQAEISIDGQPGRISECANRIESTVVAGGRLYLFTLEHERSDARAVFDAFVDTIDLTPETAVEFPGLTSTFVSPTYGYSFGYIDRGKGTLTPATEPWDPVNQPSPIDDLGASGAEYIDGFDTVATGLGAFFTSASTEIPDGVTIDKWVDEAVGKYLPPGCYAPRSQQERITIDGEPGRISQDCAEDVAATVVKDGRLYLFTMGHSARTRDEARAFFDAFVATIDLRPEAAAAP